MKKLLFNIASAVLVICISGTATAQTATSGTLTVSFTQVTKSPGYQGTKNVLAAWIQTSAGGFVKTKLRYAGGSTSDHLPTWASNSGGPSSNCLSTSCNKTDATTGATLPGFALRNFTWDGKNVNGTSNGTVVADGTYKVTIQETWNHGGTGTTIQSYTFTKGPNVDHQTPADNAYFTGVDILWTPAATTGIDASAAALEGINVYPNPSTDGIFNIEYEKANNVSVMNTLGMVVYDQKLDPYAGTQTIDLSTLSNGIYFVYVMDGSKTSKHKVVINK